MNKVTEAFILLGGVFIVSKMIGHVSNQNRQEEKTQTEYEKRELKKVLTDKIQKFPEYKEIIEELINKIDSSHGCNWFKELSNNKTNE